MVNMLVLLLALLRNHLLLTVMDVFVGMSVVAAFVEVTLLGHDRGHVV